MSSAGHNNPPDPIDDVTAPYADHIAEAENWLDGTPVENEDQMNAVDAILKEIRSYAGDLAKAEKSDTAPLYDAWKARKAAWKPTIDDAERMKKGLAALGDPFKRKLNAEKEAAKRAAYEDARRKEDEARTAAMSASAGDIEAQREAARVQAEADAAIQAAQAARDDKVKGLRKVHRYEITDCSDLLRWINANDRAALEAFADAYASKNFKDGIPRAGLRVWIEKEAY